MEQKDIEHIQNLTNATVNDIERIYEVLGSIDETKWTLTNFKTCPVCKCEIRYDLILSGPFEEVDGASCQVEICQKCFDGRDNDDFYWLLSNMHMDTPYKSPPPWKVPKVNITADRPLEELIKITGELLKTAFP
jgi:hypothetical protein